MSNVIHMHTATASRAKGAAVMVACASRRYGHDDETAESYAEKAAEMVRRGHSAARAVSTMKRRAMRNAPPPSAA